MIFTTKDGHKFDIIELDGSIILQSTEDHLADVELVFDGLFKRLVDEAIEESKIYLYDNDFLWSDSEVRDMAWERLPEALKYEYEKGNYTHRHN